MGGGPQCPQCQAEIQPTWDWCHDCGFDPEGRRGAVARSGLPESLPKGMPKPRSGVAPGAVVAIALVVVVLAAGVFLVLRGRSGGDEVGAGGPTAGAAGDRSLLGTPVVEPAPEVEMSPDITAIGWYEVTPADGSFTVVLPGRPVVTTNSTDIGGRSFPTLGFQVLRGREMFLFYAIDELDDPAARFAEYSKPSTLDTPEQAAKFGLPVGTVVSFEDVDLGGRPGKQANLTVDGGGAFTLVMRQMLVGDRIYRFVIGAPFVLPFDLERFSTLQVAP